MRKCILVLTVLLTVLSCSDDITFNSPALQGIRDTVFFKANGKQFEILETGEVLITGTLGDEQIRITLPDYVEGIYNLGSNSPAQAAFTNGNGKQFTTGFNGEGQVIVDRAQDSLLTGTFRFRAVAPVDTTEVYFTKGVFYEIPYFNAPIPAVEIPVVANKFMCKVNGGLFDSPSITASPGGQFITGGGSNRVANIRLRFPKNIEPGTYPLTDFSVASDYQAAYFSGTDLIIQSGTITITSNNTDAGSVGGTFSFVATGVTTVTVTEGVFGFNY